MARLECSPASQLFRVYHQDILNIERGFDLSQKIARSKIEMVHPNNIAIL